MTNQITVIIIVIAVIFGAIVGGVYLNQSTKRKEGEAQYQYSLAKAQFEQWKLQTGDERSKTEAELTKLLGELESKWGNSNANGLAGLMRSELALSKKNSEEAIKALEAYVNALPKNSKDLGWMPLAGAYEQASQFDKAAATYESIAQNKDSTFAPSALMGKARNLRLAGKIDEAVKTYQDFLDRYPASTEIATVRGLLAETLEAKK